MSYPDFMTDEELVTHGFVVCEDNPKKAYSTLYPNFSFRHKCDTCRPSSETKERWSAYAASRGVSPSSRRCSPTSCTCAASRRDCPVRRQAWELLRGAGIKIGWPRHERIGECYSLEQIKDWPEEKRIEFLLTLNNISVSKFSGRGSWSTPVAWAARRGPGCRRKRRNLPSG